MSLIFKDPDNKSVDTKAARTRATLFSLPFALMGIFALVLLLHDGLHGGLDRQHAMGLLSAAIVCGGLIALIFGISAKKHALKTGALIRASAVSGAIMAGADDAVVAAIDTYAGEVGLAFQIVDDILDVEGDPASLGKTAGKDAASAKPTYPALFGLDRSRALAGECLHRAQQALDDAGIIDGRLGGIAVWVVSRKS